MDESWLGVLRRINLNQLASFAAVADRGSFRAAAAQLHISQSALSVQVQQLEAALGVKLLHRDTRTVRLTDEGRRLEQVFSLSGRELARVLAQLRDEGRLQKGAIVLAVLPSLAATFLPPLMRAFQARFPGIRIRMHDADSRRAHEQIQQGAVDIAVTSRSPHNEEVGFQPLFEEPLLAVVPAADALFRSRASASLELLARRPLLLNPRGVDLRERLETLFRAAGIAAAPAQELTGTASLVALAASGMGVSIQPRSSLYGLDLGACRLLPLRPAALREIGVITPPGRTPSPATAAFHDYLVEHAASVAWPLLGAPVPHARTEISGCQSPQGGQAPG